MVYKMSLKKFELETITEEILYSLIVNKVTESRDIEYKQVLNYKDDKEKQKFLAAITSFANTNGGDILIGVKENRAAGLPEELIGIEIANPDEFTRSLENIIYNGTDPKVQRIRFKEVQLNNDKVVVIIRIPRSWAAPHRISYQDSSRFYYRVAKGKQLMDTHDIRVAFNLSSTITENIEKFRNSRIEAITSVDFNPMLVDGSKLIVHLLPFTAFERSINLDAGSLSKYPLNEYISPITAHAYNTQINFDGVLSFSSDYSQGSVSKGCYSYMQVFRNGVIELVDISLLSVREGKVIFSHSLEETLFPKLEKLLALYTIMDPESRTRVGVG